MFTAIAILTAICIVCIMLFAKDIKDAIAKFGSKMWKWVSEHNPPKPTETFIALLLAIGLFVVARGNYELIKHSLPFILPIQNPKHIALSIIVLAAMIGLILHSIKGIARYIAAILALVVVVMISGVAYLQMDEFMMANNQIGGQPIVAAMQFGAMTVMEIFCMYALMSLAGNAIGYLWLVILSPVWIIYLIAWLFSMAKEVPNKIASWKANNNKHRGEIYLEQALQRQKIAEETIVDEPRKTEKELIESYNKAIRQICTGQFNAVSKMHRSTANWMKFYGWWHGMLKGWKSAEIIFVKILDNVIFSFDEVIAKTRVKIKIDKNGRVKPESVQEFEDSHESRGIGKNHKALIALLILLSLSKPAGSEQRYVNLFVDITTSYPYTSEAYQHIAEHVVPNLSVNDAGSFFKIGNFNEQANLHFRFPAYESEAVRSQWKNIFEYKKDKRLLEDIWSKVDSIQGQTKKWLMEKVQLQDGGFTQLHQMLSYSGIQFKHFGGEKWLLVYSDLLNEEPGKKKTRLPPSIQYDFSGVNVRFLFVPFSSYAEWQKIKSAWEDYFKNAGAASFEVLDVTSSQMAVDVFPRNSVDRKLPEFKMEE